MYHIERWRQGEQRSKRLNRKILMSNFRTNWAAKVERKREREREREKNNFIFNGFIKHELIKMPNNSSKRLNKKDEAINDHMQYSYFQHADQTNVSNT